MMSDRDEPSKAQRCLAQSICEDFCECGPNECTDPWSLSTAAAQIKDLRAAGYLIQPAKQERDE